MLIGIFIGLGIGAVIFGLFLWFLFSGAGINLPW